MEFEKFSEKYKSIKSPAKAPTKLQSNSNKTETLMETIQKEDARSKKLSKQFYVITSVTAVIYIFVFIVNPDPDLSLRNRLAGSAYIVAAVLLAILFRKKHQQLNTAFYMSTPKTFLEEAKKRFQFWNKSQRWLILVILLVNIASLFSISNYFNYFNNTTGIIVYQLGFCCLLTFGFFMGKKEWQKTKKPILLKIEQMLASFEE